MENEQREPYNTKIPLKTIFQDNTGGFSSKRICGVLGWVTIIFIALWCTFNQINAPDFFTEFMIGCVTLLGVDSISKAIRGIRK